MYFDTADDLEAAAAAEPNSVAGQLGDWATSMRSAWPPHRVTDIRIWNLDGPDPLLSYKIAGSSNRITVSRAIADGARRRPGQARG